MFTYDTPKVKILRYSYMFKTLKYVKSLDKNALKKP